MENFLKALSVVQGLSYLSVLDYEHYEHKTIPSRSLELAKEVMVRTSTILETVVAIPCPSVPSVIFTPKAVIFRHKKVGGTIPINSIEVYGGIYTIIGDYIGRWIDLNEDSNF